MKRLTSKGGTGQTQSRAKIGECQLMALRLLREPPPAEFPQASNQHVLAHGPRAVCEPFGRSSISLLSTVESFIAASSRPSPQLHEVRP